MNIIWTSSSMNMVIITVIACFLSVFLMLGGILLMRMWQNLADGVREDMAGIWNPLMVKALENEEIACPPIKRRERLDFLVLWNQYQLNLRGDSKYGLNSIMERTGMVTYATGLLKSRSESERVLAALTMGHLGKKEAWEQVRYIAENYRGLSGQVAALSLARIDPGHAGPILIPLFARRPEWPGAKIASTLKELGPENVTGPLIRQIEEAQGADLPRLISFLYFARATSAAEILQKLLGQTEKAGEDHVEVISACLKESRYFANSSWVELILPYLAHPSWIVRVQAVNVLAGVARPGDVKAMARMLSEKNWWVRFRTAQAIVNLPFVDDALIDEIISEQTDRYAIDMLKQVQAEKGLEFA